MRQLHTIAAVNVASRRQAAAVQSRIPSLGRRGEGWVVLQLVLFGLIALAAWLSASQEGEPPLGLRLLGIAMSVGGLLVIGWGGAALGSFLTPFPRPTERHELVTGGPFRWVRHPIYSGVLLTALGACLVSGSWLALAFWLALCLLFDLKSRREELWLAQRHPEYLNYRNRTRKFVPWVY
jgi:protein-S-isoprenylcysteine O-methyltransferase Ste14